LDINEVRKAPGTTISALMPSGRTSSSDASVTPSSANFVPL